MFHIRNCILPNSRLHIQHFAVPLISFEEYFLVSIAMVTFIFLATLLSLAVTSIDAVQANPRNHYELLGLLRDCPRSEVRRSFRKLALLHHPDKTKDPNAQRRFIRIAAAYETLNDKTLRHQYDAMIGANGIDVNYMKDDESSQSTQGESTSSQQSEDMRDFDYEAFFKKFDDVLREHAETHLDALKQRGIDTGGVAEHLKQHLQDHLRLHREATGDGLVQSNQDSHAGNKKYRPREDIILDGLFEDVVPDEELVMDHLAALQTGSFQGSGGKKCTTKVIESDGKVETVTECVEMHEN
eukprot:gene5049-8756_t